ncbi:MAG: Ig-like domain-containing protein [Candidatus Thermoplasmatota archaeon]|nr:Ig-like domain-containing protein [Candidatus Thermoplasmatota archaeon]
MRYSAFLSAFILLMLVLTAMPILGGSAEVEGVLPTRADEEEYMLRSDTQFYPGELRNDKYADVNGDGMLDAIIISRERVGSDNLYHLHIISLNDGLLLFNHTFNLTDGGYVDLIEVDGDPLPELMVQERRHRQNRGRLFILDPPTYEILFDTGYIDGYFSGEVIGDEFFLTVYNDPYSYTPDRDTWFAAYSLSNWTMVWRTMRFPRASGVHLDLDKDGIREYIFYATWVDPVPDKAHLYFIDLDAHEVTLNSTDMEHMTYYGVGKSSIGYHDLDNDGFYEAVAVAHWSTNDTCKVFLYSASTNTTRWVSEDLGNYALREQVVYGDINDDGIEEIMLILSDPGNERISKFVVLDPLTGEILVEEQVNERFHQSCIFIEDINGDGNTDLLFYNYTEYNGGRFTVRLVEPSKSWSMAYNISIPDMRSFYVSDTDNDNIPEILVVGRGAVFGKTKMDLRRYDPADMHLAFSIGDFDMGPEGSYAWSKVYAGGSRTISGIEVNYRNPGGGNYSRLHFMNTTTGVMEYSSPFIYGETSNDIRWNYHPFDGDQYPDLLIACEWMDTDDPSTRLNLTVLDGETFDPIWQDGPYLDPAYWQCHNFSLGKEKDIRELYVKYSFEGEDRYNYTLFEVTGDALDVVYTVSDNVTHDFSATDIEMDGEYEIKDIHARNRTVNISYYRTGPGMELSFKKSFELEGDYAYGSAFDAAGDGDAVLIYRSGRDPYKVHYIDPTDFSEITVLEYDQYNKFRLDPDRDMVEEDIWCFKHDLGSDGYSNITFVDLETGLVEWELREVNYSVKIEIMDIDNDRRNEMIFIKCRYWENPYSFGISVYNVSTDLPPDPLAPLNDQDMLEDGPSVIIDLDDHFTDEDDPLTFSIEDPDSVIEWNIDTGTNELELKPAPDMNGVHILILHVMDAFWDVPCEFTVNITPVNDAPVLLNVSGYEYDNGSVIVPVDQEQENLLQINAFDIDGDELTYSLAGEQERAGINSTSGLLGFTPEVEDGISSLIWVNITDGQETITINITTVNRRASHAPFNVSITSPSNGTSSFGTWTFEGTADDVDIPWGDTLTFNWSSDLDGYLGEGRELTVPGLSPGPHVISLNVSDTDGFNIIVSIEIEVLPWASFENLTGMEPTANLSLEMNSCTVDAHFEIINGSTYATYDVSINGTGGPDLQMVMLYIELPGGVYMPYDPVMEGQATASINGTNWEYKIEYTIQLPGSDHSEGFLMTIQFDMAAVGWNSKGLFDIACKEADMTYSIDNGWVDDDDTGDDDTSDDDDDTRNTEGMGFLGMLIGIILVLILIGIIAFILVQRSKGAKKDEIDGVEE